MMDETEANERGEKSNNDEIIPPPGFASILNIRLLFREREAMHIMVSRDEGDQRGIAANDFTDEARSFEIAGAAKILSALNIAYYCRPRPNDMPDAGAVITFLWQFLAATLKHVYMIN